MFNFGGPSAAPTRAAAAAGTERDAPLVIAIGPNSLLVGRGGEQLPNYHYQIIPRFEEALLNRLSPTTSTAAAGPSSRGEASNNNKSNEGRASSSSWHWPAKVAQLAEDELLIVVFPTAWSRETRAALARTVFEDLKASSAVFVCSAVAAAYSVGMGLDGNDAHEALYGDIEEERRKYKNKIKGKYSDDVDSSDSSSSSSDDDEDDDSEPDSTSSSSDEDSEDSDAEKDAKKKKNAKSTTSKKADNSSTREEEKAPKHRKSANEDEDDDNANVPLTSSSTTTQRSQLPLTAASKSSLPTTVMPFKTPRKTSKMCVIELNYDSLTISHIFNGSVSRFVSVPHLPTVAGSDLINTYRYGTAEAQITEACQQALFSSAVATTPLSTVSLGLIPSMLLKLEKKMAFDVAQEEERSTSTASLYVDFQVVLVFTGEAATIRGMREGFERFCSEWQCQSALAWTPYHSEGYRVYLPSVCPAASAPSISSTAAASNNNTQAASSQPSAPASAFSASPLAVCDLSAFIGASVLSAVPDKVIEKASITRAMYKEKGAAVCLIRSAM